MSGWTVLGLAVGLGTGCAAVAASVGAMGRELTGRRVFRLAWHFGLFQFLMPVLGWLAGMGVQQWVAAFDHWVAFALLVGIGGKMLWESREIKSLEEHGDPTRGWTLIGLSVATQHRRAGSGGVDGDAAGSGVAAGRGDRAGGRRDDGGGDDAGQPSGGAAGKQDGGSWGVGADRDRW